jgi:hypothetical protein
MPRPEPAEKPEHPATTQKLGCLPAALTGWPKQVELAGGRLHQLALCESVHRTSGQEPTKRTATCSPSAATLPSPKRGFSSDPKSGSTRHTPCCDSRGSSVAHARMTWLLMAVELSRDRRQDGKARTEKMYRVPQAGPCWPAVGPRLERGVRHHRVCTRRTLG